MTTGLQGKRNLKFEGMRISFLAVVATVFLGGLADWVYLNSQETSIPLANTFVEYLTSYVSAIVIAGIEIAAAYYFTRKYDLGKTKRLFLISVLAGTLGFFAYIIGEVVAGLGSLGTTQASILQVIYFEIIPNDLDYGNALIIFISIFSAMLVIGVLFKINPVSYRKSSIPNKTGFVGGLWVSTVTTIAALVCCGPLPGAIALLTQIPVLYFTTLINFQSVLVLVSVPPLLIAIIVADWRAKKGCSLR
ncbi:MAG: hypothetical protein OK457_07710 [Thaumarchaeota archaeon]|nr:hypothetical protein [Nitrososphaerota archaeon]